MPAKEGLWDGREGSVLGQAIRRPEDRLSLKEPCYPRDHPNPVVGVVARQPHWEFMKTGNQDAF